MVAAHLTPGGCADQIVTWYTYCWLIERFHYVLKSGGKLEARQALYPHHHRTTRLPETPPTLHDALRRLAHLGGFLGCANNGDPGVKVLWRGWMPFRDIFDTWLLFHPPRPNDVAIQQRGARG